MKRNFLLSAKPILLILFIFLFCAGSSFAQKNLKKNKKHREDSHHLQVLSTVEFFVNDSSLPKYLKAIYKRDAARLALRLLNKEQHLSKQEIRIPERDIQEIYNILVAVRTSEYSAVDTISSIYNIRSFPVPNVENLILVFDKDADWVQPLINGDDTTGRSSINNIIREYNLVLTSMVYLDEEHAGLVLQSREPLNIPALMMKFFNSEGIGSIEEILPYGDGNDINIERTTTGWDITYSVKFGNCVTQCQKFHEWKFKVSKGGEVTYIGSSGHTIPPWVSPDAYGKKYPDVLEKK